MTTTTQTQLIGQTATIIDSEQQQFIGVSGVITNETKNTISIQGKTYLKHLITIKINTTIIKGNTIARQPSERIKVKK